MLSRTIAMAIGLMTGIATSQLPEYAQQYRQRLGGAIDELQTVVSRFESDARANNLTRDEAVQRLRGDPSDLTRRQGEAAQASIARLNDLSRQRQAMAEAGSFGRIATLAQADPAIATAAWRDFEPAVPTTAEGVAIGGAGFLSGYFLLRLLAAPFRRRQRTVAVR